MIVVVGRPAAAAGDGGIVPDGLTAAIAVAAAEAGAPVEIVGTIGDDGTGDALTVALGRRGVGHAALLRVAGAETPRDAAGQPPRLDAGDVDLGLRYLTTISALVVTEPLQPDVARVVADAAGYHSAPLVAVVPPGVDPDPVLLAADATVMTAPSRHVAPFARLVARYAAALAAGTRPEEAFTAARDATGWTAHA